ncbi:hypothetical protein SAMD00019534_109270, partial [Acytostelium subglobosum LB1]|uniref:hypothetical protein n=1 Tax=Acytostelium subglobosum LB1 TaxID=1410327 RepID=UPI000644A358
MGRIDCFNVATEQFRHIGVTGQFFKSAWTFFHNGFIYSFGGVDQEDMQYICIVSYNPKNQRNRVLLTLEDHAYCTSLCFDGVDKIYLIGHEFFSSVSLTERKETSLVKPKNKVTSDNTLLYVPGIGPILCLDDRILQYNEKENTWRSVHTGSFKDNIRCIIPNGR